jgi:N-acetylneuraminic acid mutarotase
MSIKRGDDNLYSLATNASATSSAVAIKGGEYTFLVEGTAGGSTIALQLQNPNGNWATVQVFSGSAVQFTSLPGCQTGVDLPAGNVRLAMAGGSPSGVSAWLVGLG